MCGSLEEKSICNEIIEILRSVPVLNLAGKTSLVELVEVIRGAKMLVGNDSSAIHIAAATGTPSVCIHGGGIGDGSCHMNLRKRKWPITDSSYRKDGLLWLRMAMYSSCETGSTVSLCWRD